MDIGDVHLRVLYSFNYETKHGRKVSITEGEKLFLIRKTNSDWWQVIRSSTERPFFVPASYVEEIKFRPHSPLDDDQASAPYSRSIGKSSRDEKSGVKTLSSYPTFVSVHSEPVTTQANIVCNLPAVNERISSEKWRKWAAEELISELSCVSKLNFSNEKTYSSKIWIKTDTKESLDKKGQDGCGNSLSLADKITECGHSAHLSDEASLIKCEQSFNKTVACMNVAESRCSTDDCISQYEDKHVSGQSVSSSESLSDLVIPKLREKCTENICSPKIAGKGVCGENTEHTYFFTSENQDLDFPSGEDSISLSPRSPLDSFSHLSNIPYNLEESVTDFRTNAVEKPHPDMFSKMKSKLKYSASFKTKRELQKISERREGSSVLSSSWDRLESCERGDRYFNLSSSGSKYSNSDESSDLVTDFGGIKQDSDESFVTNKKSDINSSTPHLEKSDNTENTSQSDSEYDCNANYAVSKETSVRPTVYKHSQGVVCNVGIDKDVIELSDSEGQDNVQQFLDIPSTLQKTKHSLNSIEEFHGGLATSQCVDDIVESEEDCVVNIPLPYGWKESFDEELELPCYIHEESGEKWFSSNDAEGRVYFYQENSTASSWRLPDIPTITVKEPPEEKEHFKDFTKETDKPAVTLSSDDSQIRHQHESDSRPLFRIAKARSMVLTDGKSKDTSVSTSTRNLLPWWDGKNTLKEGTLHKTKMWETGGKKVRKNWAPSYVVLNRHQLLFFKDQKTFASMKGTSSTGGMLGGPEMCIDLEGALLDNADRLSSRKCVFSVTTVHGLKVLLQCEDKSLYTEWYQAVRNAIRNITEDSGLRNSASTKDVLSLANRAVSPDRNRKIARIDRARSVKSKIKDGSLEDLSSSAEDQQIRIHTRLKNFFLRRPMKEALEQRGILKNEAVFGCHLTDLCHDAPYIPLFVRKCVEAIELKEENMKTIGLYRASGNLSQVQKIRLQVNQDNYKVLEEEEDVHVLTGALKLFFRELKEPVIPCHLFGRARDASNKQGDEEKVREFQDIVKTLPVANRNTLKFLLQHLLRVTEYTADNQMTIHTLAIVFGPSLMWPEEESQNIAFDYMMQNVVIEYLLKAFHKIFDGL